MPIARQAAMGLGRAPGVPSGAAIAHKSRRRRSGMDVSGGELAAYLSQLAHAMPSMAWHVAADSSSSVSCLAP